MDWSFNQRVDIHDVFVTIRVCPDRPLLCQSRQPPTCFPDSASPLGVLTSMPRSHMVPGPSAPVFSLVLGVFVFYCIFIFFQAMLRLCYIIFCGGRLFQRATPFQCVAVVLLPVLQRARPRRGTLLPPHVCGFRGGRDAGHLSPPLRALRRSDGARRPGAHTLPMAVYVDGNCLMWGRAAGASMRTCTRSRHGRWTC